MEFLDCKDFADICECMGRNKHDYDIVPGVSAKENANMYHSRLMLIAKCANGDGLVDLTNPENGYYAPYHYKEIDASSPFGFRLTFNDYDFAYSDSSLSARPPFLQKKHAIFAGKTFVAEFEGWLYYLNRAYQDI